MRVEVNSIDDFIEELKDERKHICNEVVRVRIDRNALNDHATAHSVIVWATALVQHDKGDWILEYGECVGEDTRSEPTGGTSIATGIIKKVKTFADEAGLKVRRGKLEIL